MKKIFVCIFLFAFSSCFGHIPNTVVIDNNGWVSQGCVLQQMRHTQQEIDPIGP